MARTPALLVPNSPEGRFYNALPDVAVKVAASVDQTIRQAAPSAVDLAGHPLFEGSQEGLTQLLAAAINQFSFEEVKQFGFQKAAQWISTLPIFPTTEVGEIVDFSGGKTPVEVLARRLPNGLYRFPPATSYALLGRVFDDNGTYRTLAELGGETKVFYDFVYGVCFSEQVAYWLTANPPVGLLGLDAVTKVTGQLLERLDKTQSSGGAWKALGPQALLRMTAEKFMARTRLSDINDLGFVEDTFIVNDESGRYEVIGTAFIDVKTKRRITEPAAVDHSFFIGDFSQGEGITYAYLQWINGEWHFVTYGKLTGLKGFLQDFGPLIKVASVVLAFYGIGAALASISSSGVGFLNVAQLTASVDNLPGVDLGVVGDIAAGVSGGVKLAGSIPGVSTMFDFGDFDLSLVDPGSFDVELTLEDIGIDTLDVEGLLADFSQLSGIQLDPGDLFTDEFGNVFNVAGEAAVLDPETYVKTIYFDEQGNVLDYTNNVLVDRETAMQAYDENGDQGVIDKIMESTVGRGGTSFVAQPGGVNRPDGTPAPAARGEIPIFQQISQEVLGWFKTITSYSLAKEQLQKTGRYTPPYATNPNGTPYSQLPGVPVRRTDGSIVTNNGNGTQTVVTPDGRVTTTPTSVNPRSFSNSQFSGAGGQLIPGVGNQTLILAGVGLIAVLLLARRK